MEDLSVGRWSVVSGRWVGGGPVGGSVVSCLWSVGWWRTCRWVGGRLTVVGGLVEDLSVDGSVKDLSVGRWSVVGCRLSQVL